MRKPSIAIASAIAVALIAVASAQSRPLKAATVEELRQQINQKTQQGLEIQKQIDKLSAQQKSLEGSIKALQINGQKLQVELSLTNNKISKSNLTLEELAGTIADTEAKIASSSAAVAENVKLMSAAEDQSFIEQMLNQKSISEAWDYVNGLRSLQNRISAGLADLKDLQVSLATKKMEAEEENKNLVSLKKQLADRTQVIEYNKQEQSKALTQTKADLAAKIKEEQAFEQELFAIESQLKITIDPKSIPSAQAGVLSWPLDNVYITQRFGKTVDARRLYVSGTHNGVDFRASIGTPLKATLSGVVQATGNTDLERGCYSYGKWVLIKHPNGLSSLYGHLSLISVSAGDTVVTGDIIGYSGKTGYATGPHLHLTVLASQGVEVQRYSSSLHCKNVTIPIAPPSAYLDPLAYLPAL